MMDTYSATVTMEDGVWLAQCDQEPTVHTWATSLTRLRYDIADAIILAADLPDDAQFLVKLLPGGATPAGTPHTVGDREP